MDEKIRAAFGEIHATQAEKQAARDCLERARRRRAAPRRSLGALAACAAVLLVLIGGWWAWFLPTSAVSVDGRSLLELELNRFDCVVAVHCEDSALAAELRGLDYTQALELLLDRLEEEQVSITVSGAERQCGRLLEQTESCAAGHGNVRCGQAGTGDGTGGGHGHGHHGGR